MDHTKNELPICSVITEDLNGRCSKLCNKDTAKSTGREIDTLTSSAACKQFINKPTNIVNPTFYTDLMFCNYLNLTSNYNVDLSLFEKCHNNIISGKISFLIPLSTSYFREV